MGYEDIVQDNSSNLPTIPSKGKISFSNNGIFTDLYSARAYFIPKCSSLITNDYYDTNSGTYYFDTVNATLTGVSYLTNVYINDFNEIPQIIKFLNCFNNFEIQDFSFNQSFNNKKLNYYSNYTETLFENCFNNIVGNLICFEAYNLKLKNCSLAIAYFSANCYTLNFENFQINQGDTTLNILASEIGVLNSFNNNIQIYLKLFCNKYFIGASFNSSVAYISINKIELLDILNLAPTELGFESYIYNSFNGSSVVLNDKHLGCQQIMNSFNIANLSGNFKSNDTIIDSFNDCQNLNPLNDLKVSGLLIKNCFNGNLQFPTSAIEVDLDSNSVIVNSFQANLSNNSVFLRLASKDNLKILGDCFKNLGTNLLHIFFIDFITGLNLDFEDKDQELPNYKPNSFNNIVIPEKFQVKSFKNFPENSFNNVKGNLEINTLPDLDLPTLSLTSFNSKNTKVFVREELETIQEGNPSAAISKMIFNGVKIRYIL